MRKTLEEVLKEMEETENNREDLNIPLSSMIMQDDGKLKSWTYGEFEPSKTATNRLTSMYNLSSNHFDVLSNAGRDDLVAETFNHFLINDNKTMKFRIVDDNRIKGIVNKNYKKFDDYHVFSQVAEYLDKYGFDYNLDILNKDDEYTRLRFMIPDIEGNMGIAEENGVDNDVVQGGFEITNSEIGLKNMGLNSLLYRQVCTNGMMDLVSDDENKEIFYKRGKDFNPFSKVKMLNNGLTNVIERSSNNIELFKKTKNIEVEKPKEEIFKIGGRYNIGKNHLESVQECFKKEPQNNMFGVINSFTRHGRSFNKNDYRNRAKFEFLANDVMKKVTA